MDPAVATRHARLIGSLRKGGPREREVLRWGYPWLNFRRAHADGCQGAKLVAAREPRGISAAAALKALWPDMYSGNEGETILGSWYGNHSCPSIARLPWPGPPQAETWAPENRY